MSRWLSTKEATERMTRRYEEQAEKYPNTREHCSLATYIAANIEYVRRTHALEGYARKTELTRADIEARRADIPKAR